MSMIKVCPVALVIKLAGVVAVCPKKTLKESLIGVRCYRARAEDITGQPGSNMGFAATDLEIGIHVGPTSDQWCLVEGAKLFECLKAFDEAEIEWDETENGLLLTGPANQFLLPYLEKSEHPDPIHARAATKDHAIVNAQMFVDGVASIEHAVARESSRMVMTGILMRIDGGSIELTGVDGRRAASCWVPLEAGMGKGKRAFFSVPRAAFLALARSINPATSEPLRISFTQNDVTFATPDFTIQSRLIEGRPPEMDAIWPDPKKTTARIQTSRQGLIDALKRVSIMTDPSIRRANVAWREKIVISTERGAGTGGTAQAVLDSAFSGSPADSAYNPGYLLEWLRAAKSDEVVLSLSTRGDAEGPLVMTAPDESGSTLRGLIMPLT